MARRADAGADAPACAVAASSDARLSDTIEILSSGCVGKAIEWIGKYVGF